MKIKTKNIQVLTPLIQLYTESGSLDKESLLIDAEGYLYFRHTQRGVGRIATPITDIGDEYADHVFVDAEKFLHMISTYNKVSLDDDGVFHAGDEGDTYQIPTFKDQSLADEVRNVPNLTDSVRDNEFEVTEDNLKFIRDAATFVDWRKGDISRRGIFIREGYLMSVRAPVIYKAEVDQSAADQAWGFTVHRVVVTIGEGAVVQQVQDHVYRITDETHGLELIANSENTLACPGFLDPEFTSRYQHIEKITLHRKNLLNSIKFLDGYVKLAGLDAVQFLVEDESTIILEGSREGLFRKTFEVDYVDTGMVGREFMVSTSNFVAALNAIPAEHVEIRESDDSSLLWMFGVENQDVEIVFAKIRK